MNTKTTALAIRPRQLKQETSLSCFRTCVAALLGVEWVDVPIDFDGDVWDWDGMQTWLWHIHNRQLLAISYVDGKLPIHPMQNSHLCIAVVKKPDRDNGHAVVTQLIKGNLILLFDPSRGKPLNNEEIQKYLCWVCFLIPME